MIRKGLHDAHVKRWKEKLRKKRASEKFMERYRADPEIRAKHQKRCNRPYSEWSEERKAKHNAKKRLHRITGESKIGFKSGQGPTKHDAHVVLRNKLNPKTNGRRKRSIKVEQHDAHVRAWAAANEAHAYRHKYRTDPEFNAKEKLRARLRKLKEGDSEIARLLSYNAKRGRWASGWSALLGYGLDDLVKHLKRTVPKRHTFEQFLDGDLEIDHIIPRSKFDLSKADEVRACWCLSNLRLLPAEDNRRKRDKVETLC